MALKRNRRRNKPAFRAFFPTETSPLPRRSTVQTMQRGGSEDHLRLRSGQFVWLRNLMSGAYLHAEEDAWRVSVRANRASRNAAWRVQLYYPGGSIVLLQGAAYGRYLAATSWAPAAGGNHGFRVAQLDFNDPEALPLRWHEVKAPWGNGVMINHISCRSLRSNGSQRQWESFVTMDNIDNLSVMMYWVVEPIARRYLMPRLPPPRQRFVHLSGPLRRTNEEDLWRVVRYVRADPDGLVNEDDWVAIPFSGRSVFRLRIALTALLGEAAVFTMCVRAGQYARLTPLVVDLPMSDNPLNIVVLMNGSPAIEELRHPNVDAAA